jgi:ABC-2 type transport system permease protein
MQHRSFFFLLAFGWMIPPLIYLFVWSTAAGEDLVNGYSRRDFIAYYLVLILVNQLTYAQTNWTVGDIIRDGAISRLLLYPMSPVYNALATEIAGKVVTMIFVIPVTAILSVFLEPQLSVTYEKITFFILTLCFSWLLRFLWGYWLALLAFWITRADSLLALQDALVFLLAGHVAPVGLLPGAIKAIAIMLPFRYMVGFPVEILTGQISGVDLLMGIALQAGWLGVAFILYMILWRLGVKRFTAIGG